MMIGRYKCGIEKSHVPLPQFPPVIPLMYQTGKDFWTVYKSLHGFLQGHLISCVHFYNHPSVKIQNYPITTEIPLLLFFYSHSQHP